MEQTQRQPDQPKKTLRPMGELFSSSFDLYKENFWKIFRMALAPYLSFVCLFFVVAVMGVLFFLISKGAGGQINDGAKIGLAIGGFILALAALLLAIYVSIIAQIGLLVTIKSLSEKIDISFKAALIKGKELSTNYLTTAVLVGIHLFIWFLLLIIPAIVMGIYYSMTIWVVVCEGLSGNEAIKRSKELVQGRWWSVFFRFILAYAVVIAINYCADQISKGDPENTKQLVKFAGSIIQLFVAPFVVVFSFYLYQDLVKVNQAGEAASSNTKPGA